MVSLRSVSSTNYPTSHHPPCPLFLNMFTNFMHHQILQYTKDTKSNTHNIYTCLSLQNSKMIKNTLGQEYTNFVLHLFRLFFTDLSLLPNSKDNLLMNKFRVSYFQ